ncbi:hypothetical protein LTR78_001509 [Recurvomyces mirabilis]|uniref:DUF218 domain-containing protein n=1 Tax=Recurvomyces mirabilis TaxID=574656 RepID=A0AAE0WWX7_9PEZI|nr:hypothetical protein LTR78_001509 [Recurvomyces mirabilis]KAK5161488.1 hypothetical protein LTS14_001284 [Recurvomyces mirabilis]
MSQESHLPSQQANCKDLIIVCCHATFSGDNMDESSWTLQDFQRADTTTHKTSEISTFLAHITAGANLYQASGEAMLMFSGGDTTGTAWTEAKGYERIFRTHLPPRDLSTPVGGGCQLEERATDSYQNLLFSILRYHELLGRYPEHITIITHAFKQQRFLELHAPAIKWPASRIRVQGINHPFTLEELRTTQRKEYENAYGLFERDLYGIREPLAGKRRKRFWKDEVAEGLSGDEVVKRLLAWRGEESGVEVFPESLPWE